MRSERHVTICSLSNDDSLRFSSLAVFILVLLFGTVLSVAGQETLVDSYIEANVPKDPEFAQFLQRDLESYFVEDLGKTARLTSEFLRIGPTQTGVAFPKYYVWVRIIVFSRIVGEWAVRVAAVEKTHFEITHAISREEIEGKTVDIYGIFPPLVCQTINQHVKGSL